MVEQIATALAEAHRTGKRIDVSAFPVPNYEQALEIQRRVQAGLGAVSGFKVARRAEGAPVIAPIRSDCTRPSGASVPVRDVMGIELEIGFELTADPSGDMLADPKVFFRPRIVLELVDTRLSGAAESPMLKLADMQINAGVVIGPAMEGWDGRDFGQVGVALRCGTKQVVNGRATVPGGSALANLALLCGHVGAHCGGLRKGQIILTGSLSGLEYFPADTEVHGKIDALGEINCQLT